MQGTARERVPINEDYSNKSIAIINRDFFTAPVLLTPACTLLLFCKASTQNPSGSPRLDVVPVYRFVISIPFNSSLRIVSSHI